VLRRASVYQGFRAALETFDRRAPILHAPFEISPPPLDWRSLNVMVTGGTGSFGIAFAELLLSGYGPRQLTIYSRDELKQDQLRKVLATNDTTLVKYVIGDVRDRDQLRRAMRGVDVAINAAALKQVPTSEFHPLEVIKTNVLGASNVIDAALDCGVRRVVEISTDKAVAPINLYGATKLCAEKLFVAAQGNVDPGETAFSVVRYGNVSGSRGSVVPLFRERRVTGVLPITDPRMTRFWFTLRQSVRFIADCVQLMRGGEIFIPKLPSMRIVDLAQAIAPECRQEIVGIRAGEKLHESLLTEDEARQTRLFEGYFVVYPPEAVVDMIVQNSSVGMPLPDGFRFGSDTNDSWLSVDKLREMVELDESQDDSVRPTVA